jgi:hypothetical protein
MVLERVRALGGLVVRLEHWHVVRQLTLQRPKSREGLFYRNWLRHGDVQAARAGMFRDPGNPRLDRSFITLAEERANALPSLRPDVLADDEALRTSMCQFDFLAAMVAVSDAGEVSSHYFYPHFCRFHTHRVEPAASRLITDEEMRAAIYPTENDQELADALWGVSYAAGRAGAQLPVWGWDGFDFGLVEKFLEEHPPSDEALALRR